MKSKTSESTIVKNIIKALDKHYPGFYFKSHGGAYQMVGLPDIIGVHRGCFIGIEVKRPGEVPRRNQLRVLERIENAGGIAFWSDNVDDVLTTLEEVFNN